MSIEFVDPGPPVADHPVVGGAGGATAARTSARAGRLRAGAYAVAGIATVTATVPVAWQYRETSFVVDFDGTTTVVNHSDVSAFGDVRGRDAFAQAVRALVGNGPDWGWAWLAVGLLLLGVAAWGLVRPRSRRPAVVATALGAVLLGHLGSAWSFLQAGMPTAPNVVHDRVPQAGFWLAVAGGLLALAPALPAALAPGARWRPHRRRRSTTPVGVELT